MAMIGQTVTIVNKSGKVVKSSKHIVNVFKEAKSAYAERKAEIKATRRREDDERLARIKLRDLEMDDDDASSVRSSRRGSEDGRSSPKRSKTKSKRSHERPPFERGVSDSFYATDRPSPKRRDSHRPSPLRDEVDAPRIGELTRRHTEDFNVAERRRHHRPSTARSASMDDIDMDLAYGELPPPLPERKYDTEIELRQKMTSLQRLLDECNCLQHSVTATIDNLQKNPDALAAVALTLAEISNIAAKMAPGALTAMKGSFPAVIALLASPQFMIAAGVGVGVTIIALGGYKIIKKVQAKKAAEAGMLLEDGDREPESPVSEADELREISGIERWRRGIADEEAQSLGTSVDGEFVTPQATRTLIEEGKLTEADLKSLDGSKSKKSKKSKKASKGETKEKSKKEEKKVKRESHELESLASGSMRGGNRKAIKEKGEKEKEPSGLKMLFRSGTSIVGKQKQKQEEAQFI